MGKSTHIAALLLATSLSGPAFADDPAGDPIEPAAIEALHAMGAQVLVSDVNATAAADAEPAAQAFARAVRLERAFFDDALIARTA